MGVRINFEIERTHIDFNGRDISICDDKQCRNTHFWSVYERSLDKDGVGDAQWQSDHVNHARAEQAAFAYRAQLVYSLEQNNEARDRVRSYFEE